MNFLFITFPIFASAMTPHRQTITRRIERVSGYIFDTRTKIASASTILKEKIELFSILGCAPDCRLEDGIDTSAHWARKIHNEMRQDGFVDRWSTIDSVKQKLYCMVLYSSMENLQEKIQRRVKSLQSLHKLLDAYETLLTETDRADTVDPKWVDALLVAEKYEKLDRGIKSVSVELHNFLNSREPMEGIGKMFWFTENTPDVVRDMIDSIIWEEDDVRKLRICLEMIQQSGTMKKWNIHELVKDIVDQYRNEFINMGNELLNTEKFLLNRSE